MTCLKSDSSKVIENTTFITLGSLVFMDILTRITGLLKQIHKNEIMNQLKPVLDIKTISTLF